ncbi:MAG TPA: tetratricopeptide repeat protein [Actinophytocola sp.]|uniref:tetratricopeptide repeat protein n=1 Tax=Actinophytocola sp. TaxID=1872138 RepID=UPI002DF9E9BF|nr:tetratricopeptide repeat protein [Actinophytocola sp.]
MHRTILAVDVEGFGDRSRTSLHQVAVRNGLYRALRKAFREADISWADCHREDRGDGVFILARPEVPKARFVDPLPQAMVDALREHNRDRCAEERIRLRMALHAGEIYVDDHGVTATAINHTFRLLDALPLKAALADSPGVLALVVSSWFYDEVVRHSSGASADSYRSVTVKVKETVTTCWIRLPDHTADTTHRNEIGHGMTRTLPRDTAAFIGRVQELAKLLAAVTKATDAGRIVAVHAIDGMAGIGKTAFAVHAAHLLADRFPDGQLFARLHAHTPGQRPVAPAEALASLLTALGVAARNVPPDLDARAAMWRDRLTGKKILLILDDAQGRQQVEPLLPATPGCLVIVTSRRRLTALDNAMPLALGTLPPHEAVALFIRLSARDDIEKHSDSDAELVRMCGYLPLGISLLAARLRHHPSWSVADLVHDLSTARDRLGKLRAEDIAVAAAFDLSYRDLPADRQRVFRYLGLHPGTELDAYSVAALTDISVSAVRAHLDELYNDHLLDEPARGRFRMHDLVREYSRRLTENDAATDREQALERLLNHYLDTIAVADGHITAGASHYAEAARSSDTGTSHPSTRHEAWAWMRTEYPNIFACVMYALHHEKHEHVIQLAAGMSTFQYAVGPWEQAIQVNRAAAAAALHIGDQRRRGDALNRLGIIQRRLGDFSSATKSHALALGIYRELGHQRGELAALNRLGILLRLKDDYPGAAAAHTRALAIAREIPEPLDEAYTLNELGIVRFVAGGYPEAIEVHTRALSIYRELNDQLGQAFALNELGVARRATGDYMAAFEAHALALSTYHDLGLTVSLAFTLNSLGSVYRAVGNFGKSIEVHREALDIACTLGDRLDQANALSGLGAAQRLTGRYSEADRALAQALRIYRDIGHRLGEAEALTEGGALLRATAGPNEALDRYAQALRIARDVHSPIEEARALEGMGRCAADRLDVGAALDTLRNALVIYQHVGAVEAGATAELIEALSQRNV